jgi:hypothetical protein
MKREWVHTFKQDHARNNTGAETESTVHEPIVRSGFKKDNLHHYLCKGNDLPLDDEVRKTLVIL